MYIPDSRIKLEVDKSAISSIKNINKKWKEMGFQKVLVENK